VPKREKKKSFCPVLETEPLPPKRDKKKVPFRKRKNKCQKMCREKKKSGWSQLFSKRGGTKGIVHSIRKRKTVQGLNFLRAKRRASPKGGHGDNETWQKKGQGATQKKKKDDQGKK